MKHLYSIRADYMMEKEAIFFIQMVNMAVYKMKVNSNYNMEN